MFCYPFCWGVKINRYVKVNMWMVSPDLRRFQTDSRIEKLKYAMGKIKQYSFHRIDGQGAKFQGTLIVK